MRSRIITLCLMLAFCGGINISYGAFAIKKVAPITATAPAEATTEVVTTTEAKTEKAKTSAGAAIKAKYKSTFHKIKAKFFPDVVVGSTDGRPGWPGIVSFICGIVACVAFLSVTGFLVFSLGAFIFGIIGLGSGYKYHLLAVIGLIIGALALLALL